MLTLYNSRGQQFEVEDWLEQLVNRIICGWYSTECHMLSIQEKADMMMVVRSLRNICNLNGCREKSWEHVYYVPRLSEDQVSFIREQFMPFLKNSDRLVSPLEVM